MDFLVADSAQAQIKNTLDQFGLGAMADTVWTWYLQGKSPDQIMLDLRGTPEYKERFPAMATLMAKGVSISEADYVNFERTAMGLMRAYGLPPGFYDDPSDFSNLIAGQVSTSELEERLKLGATAALQSPPEVRAEMQRMYGVSAGDLTAYYLDPNKAFPLLQQQYAASQVAGAADASKFGLLTKQEAEELASRGVTSDAAAKGFGALQQEHELIHALPGEQGYAGLNRQEQFGAAFGYNTAAQLELQSEADKRKAALSAGGQFFTSQKGVEGLATQK